MTYELKTRVSSGYFIASGFLPNRENGKLIWTDVRSTVSMEDAERLLMEEVERNKKT